VLVLLLLLLLPLTYNVFISCLPLLYEYLGLSQFAWADSDVVGNNGDAWGHHKNATFLEAYNCDSAGSPKPIWGDRARKQVYRTDYVLCYLYTYVDAQKQNKYWSVRTGDG